MNKQEMIDLLKSDVEAGAILFKNVRSGATITLGDKGDMAKFKNKEVKQ